MNKVQTPEYHSVLIPVDFSETSSNAFNYGIKMAKLFNNKIVLLNVISGSFLSGIFGKKEDLVMIRERIEQKLNEYKNDILQMWPEARVEIMIEEGKPYKVINDVAKDLDCDTIVMGTNGANKVERFTGSTTLRVISDSDVPVIVIKEQNDNPQFKNLVLPIDLTKTSRQKTEWAIKMGQAYGATLHIIMELEKDELLKKKINSSLNQVENMFREAGVQFISKLLDEREYPDHLGKDTIKYAEDVNADLILIMTQAENAKLSEFFVGTYAQQIVKSSQKTPVMCLKPKQTGTYAKGGAGFY
jgi:nucleotide-binding universal stress UspA family protein